MALVEVNFYAKTLERTVTFNAIIPTDKSLFSSSPPGRGRRAVRPPRG